ncbi:hypothetical protein IMAU70042_02317 [Lactiplantibacillus plantarum]|nr:hypothetical protein [Lactiplantibacillus plantarum]
MILFLDGNLMQVADTDEENINQWLEYTRSCTWGNSIGLNEYLIARKGATEALRDEVDSLVMQKLRAITPQASVPKTYHARHAAQIMRNWVRTFADDDRVPEMIRSQAEQILEVWRS